MVKANLLPPQMLPLGAVAERMPLTRPTVSRTSKGTSCWHEWLKSCTVCRPRKFKERANPFEKCIGSKW